MKAAKRSTRGCAFNSGFTEEDIRRIRCECALGKSKWTIALEEGVAISTIRKIARRETFDWVSDDPDMPSRMPVNASVAERAAALEEYRAIEDREALAMVQRALARAEQIKGGGK